MDQNGAFELKEEKDDGVIILHLKGRLDAVTSKKAEEVILHILDRGKETFIFDLSDLHYISSAGMRVLLSVSKRMKAKEMPLIACSLQTQVHDVLEITGFDQMLEIATDKQEAKRLL